MRNAIVGALGRGKCPHLEEYVVIPSFLRVLTSCLARCNDVKVGLCLWQCVEDHICYICLTVLYMPFTFTAVKGNTSIDVFPSNANWKKCSCLSHTHGEKSHVLHGKEQLSVPLVFGWSPSANDEDQRQACNLWRVWEESRGCCTWGGAGGDMARVFWLPGFIAGLLKMSLKVSYFWMLWGHPFAFLLRDVLYEW